MNRLASHLGRARVHVPSARYGFTLVEVLVTMALMVIILPVAMRGISVAIMAASTARHRAEASTLAQSKLHEITVAMSVLADESMGSTSGDFGEMWPGYKWSTQMTNNADLHVNQITLNVEWIERGQSRVFSVSTFVPYQEGIVMTAEEVAAQLEAAAGGT
jgi:prepilin-type N-terminal cleavage/methylation domain-containing protein